MVTREIADADFLSKFHKFNGLVKAESSRLCPIHHSDVTVHKGDSGSDGIGFGPPPLLVFQGCCDEAIDEELQFIINSALNLLSEYRIALHKERLHKIATQAFSEAAIKHGTFSIESLKAEENYLRTKIEAAKAGKEYWNLRIRRDAGVATELQIDEAVKGFTRNIDKDIWQAEQELESNLEEQRRLETT